MYSSINKKTGKREARAIRYTDVDPIIPISDYAKDYTNQIKLLSDLDMANRYYGFDSFGYDSKYTISFHCRYNASRRSSIFRKFEDTIFGSIFRVPSANILGGFMINDTLRL